MQTLGERIEFYRKRNGLSRHELATLVGVHINTLGHWIRNEKEPGVKKVELLATHLNVDLNELITGEASPKYRARRKIRSLYVSDEKAKRSTEINQAELEDLLDKLFKMKREDFELVRRLVEKLVRSKGKFDE